MHRSLLALSLFVLTAGCDDTIFEGGGEGEIPTDAAGFEGVQAIVDTYANAQTERRHVAPKDLGVKAIGHFGFFTSKFSASLWKQAAEWLDK